MRWLGRAAREGPLAGRAGLAAALCWQQCTLLCLPACSSLTFPTPCLVQAVYSEERSRGIGNEPLVQALKWDGGGVLAGATALGVGRTAGLVGFEGVRTSFLPTGRELACYERALWPDYFAEQSTSGGGGGRGGGRARGGGNKGFNYNVRTGGWRKGLKRGLLRASWGGPALGAGRRGTAAQRSPMS